MKVPDLTIIQSGNYYETLPLVNFPEISDEQLCEIVRNQYNVVPPILTVTLIQIGNDFSYRYRDVLYCVDTLLYRISQEEPTNVIDITTSLNHFRTNPVLITTENGVYILNFISGRWLVFYQTNPSLAGQIRTIQLLTFPNLFVMKKI